MAPLLVLILLFFAPLTIASGAGFRVELTRIHSSGSPATAEFVRAAVHRDMRRSARLGARLASSSRSVTAPLARDPWEWAYLMTLAIGTPPLTYQAIADTGSDLIWTQCAPCSAQCFPQPTPLYNPQSSSTYAVLPCNSSLSICGAQPNSCPCAFREEYGSGWTDVVQSTETFTFGSGSSNQVRVPGLTFGCSFASSSGWLGSSGIVGLGRGKLSLVSQLGAGAFSYCLTPYSDTSSTSPLFIGPSATLTGGGIQSTPFVKSPSRSPMSTYYYISLNGITVGATTLAIPANIFSLNADGTGGMIIDSGTSLTYLVDTAYQKVRSAVESLVNMPPANASGAPLDLCFSLPSSSSPPTMPDMTFHFDGGDMALPVDNYMVLLSNGNGNVIWCLAMLGRADGSVSTLGNYQQQNMHLLYDVANEVLSFAPAQCSSL